jgi:hypothetical protein
MAQAMGSLRTECSQMVRTSQPKRLSSRAFLLSLALFAESFARQKSTLDLGIEQ